MTRCSRWARSAGFDGEGVKTGMLTPIEDGVLQCWWLDSASARQLETETNGRAARSIGGPPSPSATNLYMQAGDDSVATMLKNIGTGFYVTELIGMGVNGVTGDYSRGASGFWIENGEIAFPVSEMTIAGNLKEMFLHMTPADDLQFRRGVNAPFGGRHGTGRALGLGKAARIIAPQCAINSIIRAMRRARKRQNIVSETSASEQLTAGLTPEKLAIVQEKYQTTRSRSLALIGRMLRSYLRPYLWLLGVAFLANFIVAATTGALPWFIQRAIDDVFTEPNETMLVLIPLGVILISIIKGGATYLSNVILNYVGQRSTSNLQRDLFARLVRGDLAYVSQQHSGAYISIFMTDAIRLRDSIKWSFVALVRHTLTIIALTIFMFSINWQLALVYTIIVIPMGVHFVRRLGRVTRTASHQGLEETSEFSTLIAETLSGLRVVKAYGQENDQIDRAGLTIDRVLEFTMRALRARAAASPALRLWAALRSAPSSLSAAINPCRAI